jgi:hypothetical protein
LFRRGVFKKALLRYATRRPPSCRGIIAATVLVSITKVARPTEPRIARHGSQLVRCRRRRGAWRCYLLRQQCRRNRIAPRVDVVFLVPGKGLQRIAVGNAV